MKTLLLITLQLVVLNGFSQWEKSDHSPSPLGVENKLEFDAEFASDNAGNTYYCWTDFRNGKGELYAQKLNKFGEAQWEKNGVKVGTVVDAVNYTLTLKSIYALSNGNVFIAWHRVNNLNSPAQKEIKYNIIGQNGKVLKADFAKINVDRSITNSDVTLGTLAVTETLEKKIRVVFNTGTGFGGNSIVGVDMNQEGAVEGNWFLVDESFSEGSKVVFDETNKRMIVLMNNGSGNFKLTSYGNDRKQLFSNDNFLKNPFQGDSRFDDFTVVKGQIIIGRTLTGNAGRKVIAHRLDESLKSIWGEGGVLFGSGTGFDIHASLNSDGGGSVAWIEPNSTNRMMAARFNESGTVLWEKPIYIGKNGKSYFTPNKYASDGQNGLYNLWFTTKNGGGFNLSLQHLDGNGNQVWGEDGLQIEGFMWFGVYRVFPHISGGVIALYSGTTNSDINANDTYNLYTNYISGSGEFGLDQKLNASLVKSVYCTQDTLMANLEEGNYTATLKVNGEVITLPNSSDYNRFALVPSLEAGSYEVTFTNDKNLSSDPIPFSIRNLSKPSLSGEVLEKCIEADNALTLQGSCENGNIYWSTNENTSSILVSPNISTVYTASCRLEGCSNSAASDIEVKVISVNATASNSGPYFEGETAKLSGSGGGSYAWSGPNNFISTEQSPTIENSSILNAGEYQLVVTNGSGCSKSVTTILAINKILSTENPASLGLKIYPNPSHEFLKYPENLKIKEVAAISGNGEQSKLYFDKTERIIKISELAAGAYILRIRNEENVFSFSRFIKL